MSHYDDLVSRYINAWNEVDDRRRAALVHETWSEHGTYAAPLMDGAGHACEHDWAVPRANAWPSFRA
jgi:hypothetical protein